MSLFALQNELGQVYLGVIPFSLRIHHIFQDSHKFNPLKQKCTSGATITWEKLKGVLFMGSENFCFVGFLNTEKAKVYLQRYLIKKSPHFL